MKVNSIVRCIEGSSSVLFEDEYYRVAVIVESGVDYHGPTQGLIVVPVDEKHPAMRWPYVWNAERFVEVK